MAGKTEGTRIKSSWAMWAFWAAGVGLLLVELRAAMEYVEVGLEHNMASMLGCLPAMGMITLDVAEHSVWHWGTLQLALQSVPMVVTGLLLAGAAVLVNQRTQSKAK